MSEYEPLELDPNSIAEIGKNSVIKLQRNDYALTYIGLTDGFEVSPAQGKHEEVWSRGNLPYMAELEGAALRADPNSEYTKKLSNTLNRRITKQRAEVEAAERIRMQNRGGNPNHLTANYHTD